MYYIIDFIMTLHEKMVERKFQKKKDKIRKKCRKNQVTKSRFKDSSIV